MMMNTFLFLFNIEMESCLDLLLTVQKNRFESIYTRFWFSSSDTFRGKSQSVDCIPQFEWVCVRCIFIRSRLESFCVAWAAFLSRNAINPEHRYHNLFKSWYTLSEKFANNRNLSHTSANISFSLVKSQVDFNTPTTAYCSIRLSLHFEKISQIRQKQDLPLKVYRIG